MPVKSGLTLLAKGADFRHFEVAGVEPGSPAGVAGVQVGDLLAAMDGRVANELSLQKIDEILQQGKKAIPMTVQRGQQILHLTLRVKERI